MSSGLGQMLSLQPAQETPCRLLAALQPGGLHSGRSVAPGHCLGSASFFLNTCSSFPLCCLVLEECVLRLLPEKGCVEGTVSETPPANASVLWGHLAW